MSNDLHRSQPPQPQLPVKKILFFSLLLSAIAMLVIGTLMLTNIIPMGLPAVGYILFVIAAFDLLMAFAFFRP